MKYIPNKGASIVEFLLVFPILIVIVFGIVEFSILFYDKAVITNASREGARYGIIPQGSSGSTFASSSAIISYTQTYCANNLITFSSPAPTATVTTSSSPSTPAFGGQLSVTVTYPYTFLFMSKLLGISSQLTLSSTTVMIYE